jgi:hypothetical protein
MDARKGTAEANASQGKEERPAGEPMDIPMPAVDPELDQRAIQTGISGAHPRSTLGPTSPS